MTKGENLSYEEASNLLEDAILRLEQGELSLEKSLQTFEEAVKLAHHCKKILNQAEKRLAVLIEDESGDLKLDNLSLLEDETS